MLSYLYKGNTIFEKSNLLFPYNLISGWLFTQAFRTLQIQQLIHPIVDDQPDPAAANALQEGLGGQKALETKLFSAEVPQSVVGHH